ncbi:HEAT repeat domain-containing protein [candidate division WOR-3 bacterium]|nr:HEAT repeat domain-containing protein [candidate division WOR-3 bacterium]
MKRNIERHACLTARQGYRHGKIHPPARFACLAHESRRAKASARRAICRVGKFNSYLIFWSIRILGVIFLIFPIRIYGNEKPDTSLWHKYEILPKKGLFKIKREYSFPLHDILGKEKIYARCIAAAPIGGLREEIQISLVKIPLKKKIIFPLAFEELPISELQREKELEISKSVIEEQQELPKPIKIEITPLEIERPIIAEISPPAKIETKKIKITAIKALGVIKEESSIPLLREALKEKEWSIKREAAGALAELGDTIGLSFLRTALEEKETAKKLEIISTLGRIGDIASVPFLRKLLDHKEWAVRREAAFALSKIGDKTGLSFLQRAVGSEDSNKKIEAAMALAEIGDDTGLPELICQLTDKDSHTSVRIAALKSIGKVGKKNIIPVLNEIMKKDPELIVRIIASESILKINKRRK